MINQPHGRPVQILDRPVEQLLSLIEAAGPPIQPGGAQPVLVAELGQPKLGDQPTCGIQVSGAGRVVVGQVAEPELGRGQRHQPATGRELRGRPLGPVDGFWSVTAEGRHLGLGQLGAGGVLPVAHLVESPPRQGQGRRGLIGISAAQLRTGQQEIGHGRVVHHAGLSRDLCRLGRFMPRLGPGPDSQIGLGHGQLEPGRLCGRPQLRQSLPGLPEHGQSLQKLTELLVRLRQVALALRGEHPVARLLEAGDRRAQVTQRFPGATQGQQLDAPVGLGPGRFGDQAQLAILPLGLRVREQARARARRADRTRCPCCRSRGRARLGPGGSPTAPGRCSRPH